MHEKSYTNVETMVSQATCAILASLNTNMVHPRSHPSQY